MAEQKEHKLYAYTEAAINSVLAQLGELKAKDVLGAINTLLKPVKVENMPEVKQETSEQ